MATDISDPTPLDLSIWNLYLATREIKDGPLAQFARSISGAARTLFPLAHGRATGRAYYYAHHEKQRAYHNAYARASHASQPERHRALWNAYAASRLGRRHAYDAAYRAVPAHREAERARNAAHDARKRAERLNTGGDA